MNVDTDLTITGKVAQFGRGALADVGDKLLKQFVSNLETKVLAGSTAVRRSAPHRRAPPDDSRASETPGDSRTSGDCGASAGAGNGGAAAAVSPNGATEARKVESRGRADRPARNGRGAGAQARCCPS